MKKELRLGNLRQNEIGDMQVIMLQAMWLMLQQEEPKTI